jgi:hypothetical protein
VSPYLWNNSLGLLNSLPSTARVVTNAPSCPSSSRMKVMGFALRKKELIKPWVTLVERCQIMSHTRRGFLITSMILPRLASAADHWVDRKPEEWTPEDIQTVLNHSAWIRKASLGFGDEEGTKRTKEDATRLTGFNPLIRWESGLPVRLARRIATLAGPGLDHYVVSVSRLPLRLVSDVSGRKEGEDVTRIKVVAELGKSTFIERPGKASIHAVSAEWIDSDLSPRFSITFPPQTPIELAEREVVVVGHVGSLPFRANFPLKPMVYRGKLEL